jgi:hypothetical protein
MSIRKCLASAVAQGALAAADAERLGAAFDDAVAAHAKSGAADPRAAAQAALVQHLKDEAARKRWLTSLADARAKDIMEVARAHRRNGAADVTNAMMAVIENRNLSMIGAPSVVGRRDALTGYAHGRLEEMLYAFRRKAISGRRHGRPRMAAMVDEAFKPGSSGDAAARGFLEAFQGVAEEFRQMFNAAGGRIAKLDGWFPQRHEGAALARAGRTRWIADITPLLDVARMIDETTGQPFAPSRLEHVLGEVFDTIVTNGVIDRLPSRAVAGRGALSSQRAEHRFLHFRDADAWRAYNRAYGGDDVFAAMIEHLRGMAKDVAALEILGPNPSATVTWMEQVIEAEAAKALVGQESLYRGVKRAGAPVGVGSNAYLMRRLWDQVNGSVGVGNLVAADAMQGLRNVLTGIHLSSAALTAMATDPFQSALARTFAGMRRLDWIPQITRQLFSTASRREVQRSGVIIEDALAMLRFEVAQASLTTSSRELTQWVPDRVFQWTLLTPWTNANRRANAQAFMFQAGDVAGRTLADLDQGSNADQRFARHLRGFGINDADWDRIRATPGVDHGEAGMMLRPIDVMRAAGDDRALFDLGLRYSEALHGFVEEAVPQGTQRVRAALTGGTKPGTIAGEGVRSATAYLSYPVSVLMSLIRAVALETAEGRARGAAFAVSAGLALTIGGALAVQLAEVRKGRDPRPMDDANFWLTALVKGGALGFWGDYVLAEETKFGAETAARLAGPIGGLLADVATVANPRNLLEEDANAGRAAVRLARRYTPQPWFVKPVMERMIFDRLQLLADPNAYRAWRRREAELRRRGQRFYWPPGADAPRRAPDWSAALPD